METQFRCMCTRIHIFWASEILQNYCNASFKRIHVAFPDLNERVKVI